MSSFHGTTILAVRRFDAVAMAGDGQVTMGDTVMKSNARKVRKIYDGKILVGFAGATADAFTLFERFEGKVKEYGGDITRAAVELAKDWRTDRILRRLEALLLVADRKATFLISGTGDVVEPEEGVIAIGSGGSYRLRGGPRLPRRLAALGARDRGEVASHRRRASASTPTARSSWRSSHERRDAAAPARGSELTPREIVAELDKYIIGQDKAKKAVAIALRNRSRRQKLPEELRDEVAPKNIIMIGPTGVGKTEIARRLAKLCGAPFLKVEATKYTEVGYVGRDVESMIRDLMSVAVSMVKAELSEGVRVEAERRAEEALLDLLLPGREEARETAGAERADRRGAARARGTKRARRARRRRAAPARRCATCSCGGSWTSGSSR